MVLNRDSARPETGLPPQVTRIMSPRLNTARNGQVPPSQEKIVQRTMTTI